MTETAPEAGAGAAAAALLSIAEFGRVQLKVGQVVEASAHPKADRLLLLKVDLGEASPRQLVAGLRSRYQPESLVGRRVVVVVNLQPAVLRGERSDGMVLAAVTSDGQPVLLTVDEPVPNGAQVR